MADVALINAINQLITAIKTQTGGSEGIVSPGRIIDPNTGGFAGGKNMQELFGDLSGKMEKLTDTIDKSSRAQKDGLEKQVRNAEILGATMAALGPMLQQFTKYGLTRPFEMLGGAAGQVGRGMLEREKDAGQLFTGVAAMATILSGNPLIGGAIAGVGHLGLNQMIGRWGGFQPEAIRAGGLQTVAQMTQERIPGFRDAAMQQYGLMRQDVALLGMGGGGGRGTSMAAQLTALGMSAPESTELIARAISVGGVQGFKRLEAAGGARAITDIVNKGIYGTDPAQIAVALASGLRIGFSREMMEGASRRTGLQLPEMAQAAQIARMQTYLAGPAAGNRLFTMASNTQMARDVGMGAAMGAITQAAGGAAASAEGDEASSMLLYRQFLEANPGSTYLDFVEARRNKENDPKWLKMVGGAARNFAGMGQTGRILGSALLGTRPMMIGGTATLMDQALRAGGVGEIMGERGTAGLAAGAQQMMASDFALTMASATKFQAEYGDKIKETTASIEKATSKADSFTVMLLDMANVMDKLTVSGARVVVTTWGNALMRPDGMIDVTP